jgi:DNA-binding transcriptional MocR family regulator
MLSYIKMSRKELESEIKELGIEYEQFKSRGLQLDMSRGKPGVDQLDLSMAMLTDMELIQNPKSANGADCRNYGILDGIIECKELFARLLEVGAKNIIVGGNSSLNLMYDYIAQCMIHGAGSAPWASLGKIKFACPVPGYDRHFTICESLGIEMINVPMLEDGPDMDILQELIKDSSVKGMFCVPKYSNPEGKTFSAETVRRIAALKPAASDFRVIWDNAYCVHDLYETGDKLLNIFEAAKEYGNEDIFIEVASTSKISFPGAGVAAIAASDNNIAAIKKRMSAQIIGYDKLNMLRHARFFKDERGVKEHMKKHAAILKPKFEAVLSAFEKELSSLEIATWLKPNGGYFISLNVMDGCAKRVVELCRQAGVVLTPAGATYPYGKDPKDSNIRIAPTYPPVSELKTAVALLCICVRIACAERILNDKVEKVKKIYNKNY